MSRLLACLPDEQRTWLLFQGSQSVFPVETKEESLAVVVDFRCDGMCSSLLAHQFHGPELWFLDVRNGSLFGQGYQLRGRSPVREVGKADGVDLVRYVVVEDNGVTSCVFSKKIEDVVALAYMQETVTGSVISTYETVDSSGETIGSPQEAELIRNCPSCSTPHELCACSSDVKEQKLAQMSLSKLANNLDVREPSLKGVFQLNSGNLSASVYTHYLRDDEIVQSCRDYVGYCHSKKGKVKGAVAKANVQGQKVCKSCGTQFLKSYHLRRHYESVHCGLKRHECRYCGRTFSQSGHLNEHIRTFHLMTSSCKCMQCGKRFGAQSKLARHISAVHENLRLYACHLCPKSFKEKSHLNKHFLSHPQVVHEPQN